MNINDDGLNLIKNSEGLKLHSYQDSVNVWTIGYGSTGPDIGPNMTWTEDEAEERLKNDLAKFEAGVSDCVTVSLTSNQFSALVCFSYNVGLGNLRSSTLLKDLNAGDYTSAANQFLRWNRAGGNVLPGLTTRRENERTLFLKDA